MQNNTPPLKVGVIKHIFDVENVEYMDKDSKQAVFKKRVLVMTIDNGEHPDTLFAPEFNGDRCEILDKYKIGDLVQVTWDARAKMAKKGKHKGKMFNTVTAWHIEEYKVPPVPPLDTEETDDLPF